MTQWNPDCKGPCDCPGEEREDDDHSVHVHTPLLHPHTSPFDRSIQDHDGPPWIGDDHATDRPGYGFDRG